MLIYTKSDNSLFSDGLYGRQFATTNLDDSLFSDGLYGRQFATTSTANHQNNSYQVTAAKTDSCVLTTTPSPSLQPENTQSFTYRGENLSHSEQASPVMTTSEVALVSSGESDSSTTSSSTFHRTERKTASPKPNYRITLRKTTMCEHILYDRPCDMGARCDFAHTVSELKPRIVPPNFKKEPCNNRDPHNFKGCLYRHSGEQLIWTTPKDVTVMIPSSIGNEKYVVYMKGQCR